MQKLTLSTKRIDFKVRKMTHFLACAADLVFSEAEFLRQRSDTQPTSDTDSSRKRQSRTRCSKDKSACGVPVIGQHPRVQEHPSTSKHLLYTGQPPLSCKTLAESDDNGNSRLEKWLQENVDGKLCTGERLIACFNGNRSANSHRLWETELVQRGI